MLITFYIMWLSLGQCPLAHHRKWIKPILIEFVGENTTEFSSKEFFIPYFIRILLRIGMYWVSTSWASGWFHLFQLGFVVWFGSYPLGICKIITLLQKDRNTLRPEANIKLRSSPPRPEIRFKIGIFHTANEESICIISWNY